MVDAEVARIDDQDLRDAATRTVIEPRLRNVPWDYGEEGEAYPCWIVADLQPGWPYVVAYSDHGFGPEAPFGILDADLSSMGMDSQWSKSLAGALRSCGFGKSPPGYEVD